MTARVSVFLRCEDPREKPFSLAIKRNFRGLGLTRSRAVDFGRQIIDFRVYRATCTWHVPVCTNAKQANRRILYMMIPILNTEVDNKVVMIAGAALLVYFLVLRK